jgi:hypothetical protein
MRKTKQLNRLVVNVQTHAQDMRKSMGKEKALQVAANCIEGAKKGDNKESKKTLGFWTDVYNIINKS